MTVNVISKGKAKATDFPLCPFLDEDNLHISRMKENVSQCVRVQERCTTVCDATQVSRNKSPLLLDHISQVSSQCRSCLPSIPLLLRVFELNAA